MIFVAKDDIPRYHLTGGLVKFSLQHIFAYKVWQDISVSVGLLFEYFVIGNADTLNQNSSEHHQETAV